MGRGIYIWQNQNDLKEFFDCLKNKDVNIHSQLKTVNEEFKATDCIYHLSYEDNSYIELMTCFNSNIGLQNGRIYLHENFFNDERICSLYEQIKNFIKKQYIRSDDKTSYAGPNIYREWQNGIVNLGFMFQREEFNVPLSDEDFSKIICYIKTNGFEIVSQKADVRSSSLLDLTANLFVVYSPQIELKSKIISRRIFYDYNSKSLFIQRGKNGSTTFLVDKRFVYDDSVIKIFRLLKEKLKE